MEISYLLCINHIYFIKLFIKLVSSEYEGFKDKNNLAEFVVQT